jgi:hypothetical protein
MYDNIAPEFLKTYASSKQEEFLKEAREHTLSQELLASRKAQKQLKTPGRVNPALRWLTFISNNQIPKPRHQINLKLHITKPR